jgi:hypothetical protein
MTSQSMVQLIHRWLAEARSAHPSALSKDGTGVMIYCDDGGAVYIRADGSVIFERADTSLGSRWHSEPISATSSIVAAANQRSGLAELLPPRPSTTPDCDECAGTGWLRHGSHEVVCSACQGLGWRSAI